MSPSANVLNINATYNRLTSAIAGFEVTHAQSRYFASPINSQPIGSRIQTSGFREGSEGDTMHKLILVKSGYLDIEGCAGGWIVLPGHMILIPAQRAFNISTKRKTHIEVVHLSPSDTPWQHHGCWVTLATPLAREMIAHAISMSEIMDQAQATSLQHGEVAPPSHATFSVYISALSALCQDWFTNLRMLFLPSAQNQDAERLIDYLRHNIATANVEEAAEKIDLPQRSLHRLCITQFGFNLRALIREIRIIRAMELLSTTDMPIGLIGQTIGFSSLSAFTSAFTSRTGLTPRQFSAQNRVADLGDLGSTPALVM